MGNLTIKKLLNFFKGELNYKSVKFGMSSGNWQIPQV